MSLATLKRKTKAKYNNVSTNTDGFSINGIHRNQGYVGQSSVGRALSRAIGYEGDLKGHGGCCGKYTNGPVLKSGVVQIEATGKKMVKSSVLSSRGVLSKKLRCCETTWKSGSAQNTNTQGDYLEYRKQIALQECKEEEIVANDNDVCSSLDAYGSDKTYDPYDVVKYEDKVYRVKDAQYPSSSHSPINPTYWEEVGQCSDKGLYIVSVKEFNEINKYIFNNEITIAAPPLIIDAGMTYTFVTESDATSHPFRIKDAITGTDVGVLSSDDTILTWTPLYRGTYTYYCNNHVNMGMGNKITVLGEVKREERNKCYDKKCNITKAEETFMSITQGEYIMRKRNKCPDLTKEGMYFIHSNGPGIVCAGAST